MFFSQYFLQSSDLSTTHQPTMVGKYKYRGNKVETETNFKDMLHILSDA